MSVEAPPQNAGLVSAPVCRAYHKLSRHQLRQFAPGPEYLDWADQPSPFREFTGSPRLVLPRPRWPQAPGWRDMHFGTVPACTVDLNSLSRLLALAGGLSIWKTQGSDRWSLRQNPSSGNLHPVEWYISARGVAELDDGIYHYDARYHTLALRSDKPFSQGTGGTEIHVALSVCAQRTLWKYGERALRYTELDTGHALGSLSYAAIALGWRARFEAQVSNTTLARWLGLDRDADFPDATGRETPRALLSIDYDQTFLPPLSPDAAPHGSVQWYGKAGSLGERSLFRWRGALQAGRASAAAFPWPQPDRFADRPPAPRRNDLAGMTLIRQRRSARVLDPEFVCDQTVFSGFLRCMLPDASTFWTVRDGFAPRVHLLAMVHAVSGVDPGLYFLPRHREAAQRLLLAGVGSEQLPSDVSDELPLLCLQRGNLRSWSRACGCHQSLTGNSAFSLIMLGEFDRALDEAGEAGYRALHHEAGLLGQLAYLEAGARQLGASGIGCFFDEEVERLLGLQDTRFQALYMFALGRSLGDDRLEVGQAWPQENFPQ
jgi:SagB-type dehydrogenase family enzyme